MFRHSNSANMIRGPRRTTWCASLFLVFAAAFYEAPATAQLPTLALRSLSRAWMAPGETIELSVTDSRNGDEVSELLFSHPGITAEVLREPPKPFAETDSPRYGQFRVQVGKDVPGGRYEVRAVGRFGISNPRSILVSPRIRQVDAVGHTADAPTPIELDTIACRQLTPSQIDVYAIELQAGQELLVQLLGDAIDSRLIGSIVVYGPDGNTIASVFGSERLDARVRFRSEQGGRYLIAVHDALYRGGSNYQYGLFVGPPDSKSGLEVFQTEPPGSAATDLSFDHEDAPPVTTEDISIPFQTEHRFGPSTHSHAYQTSLNKAEPVSIEVASDRLGQATDLRLQIDRNVAPEGQAPEWKQVALADDSPNVSDGVMGLFSKDPFIRFTPPENGVYRVSVTDLDTGNAFPDRQRYCLSIGPTEPEQRPNATGWSLLAYHLYPHKDLNTSQPSGVFLPAGGTTVVRVFCDRKNMKLPVRVSIPNLPDGLRCPPAWIAANQTQTDLVIHAQGGTKISPQSFEIVGEVTEAGRTETEPAATATVVWERDGQIPLVQTRLCDMLFIASSDVDQHPVSITPTNDDSVVIQKGKKTTVPLTIERRDGGNQPITLRIQNPPPGVKVPDLTIPADKTQIEWTVEATADAVPGNYSIWGQGETKVKFAHNPQAVTRITQYRDHLKVLRNDPKRSQDHAALDQAIAEAEKQLQNVTKQAAPRDLTLYVPSGLITLKIQ
jgi:hypothetical protein